MFVSLFFYTWIALSFCFYVSVVHSLGKEDFLDNLHILSCFVQLKGVLFNQLCFLDLFFRTLAVNSVSLFLLFITVCKFRANTDHTSPFLVAKTNRQLFYMKMQTVSFFVALESEIGRKCAHRFVFSNQKPSRFNSTAVWPPCFSKKDILVLFPVVLVPIK